MSGKPPNAVPAHLPYNGLACHLLVPTLFRTEHPYPMLQATKPPHSFPTFPLTPFFTFFFRVYFTFGVYIYIFRETQTVLVTGMARPLFF